VGAALMVVSLRAGSGAMFLTGLGLGAAGAVAGPASGWSHAGYSGRAAGSALLRVGIITGTVAYSIMQARGDQNEYAGLSVVLSGLTGVTLATLEAWYECQEIGEHVRKHGVGPGRLSLEARPSPAGAPALGVVTRF